MTQCQSNPVMAKYIGDDRVWMWSFAKFPEISDLGATITSITSVTANPTGGLIIGAAAIATGGTAVKVRLSGGNLNTEYTVAVQVGLDSADQLVGVISIPILPT